MRSLVTTVSAKAACSSGRKGGRCRSRSLMDWVDLMAGKPMPEAVRAEAAETARRVIHHVIGDRHRWTIVLAVVTEDACAMGANELFALFWFHEAAP